MSLDPNLGPPSAPRPVDPLSAPRDESTRPQRAQESGGPAFQALLDALQARAQALDEESERVEGPDELGRAVESARETLEDALGLRDQLLEALHRARLSGKRPADG